MQESPKIPNEKNPSVKSIIENEKPELTENIQEKVDEKEEKKENDKATEDEEQNNEPSEESDYNYSDDFEVVFSLFLNK